MSRAQGKGVESERIVKIESLVFFLRVRIEP